MALTTGIRFDSGSEAPVTVATAATPSAYFNAVIADKPVGYWRLDESSGTAAADSSGHNLTGTYLGGDTRSAAGSLASDSDAAVTLDGTSGYIWLNDPTALQPTSVSVEAWVKTSASGAGIQRVVRKRLYGYSLEVDTGTGLPGFWVYSGASASTSAQTRVAGSTRVNDNQWHYLVGTYDGTTVRLFVDGGLAASATASKTGALAYMSGGVAIGRDGDASNSYFRGSLDEVAIYPTALSGAQVANHYQTARGTTTTTTTGNVWEIESGTLSGSAAIGTDTAASGGKFVQFRLPAGVQTFNVKNYGAKGDGATNDTTAIQNAINAAANASPHGIVIIPPGTYSVGSLYSGSVEILGYGPTNTVLKMTDPNNPGIRPQSTKLRGVTLQGTNISVHTSGGCGPHAHGVEISGSGSLIEDIRTLQWGCAGLATAAGSNLNIINHNVVHDAWDEGITLYNNADDNFIEYNYSYHNQLNGIGENGDRNIIRFNNVVSNGQLCLVDTTHYSDCAGVLVFQNASGTSANDTVIERNTATGNVEYGVYVQGTGGSSVQRTMIAGNTIDGSHEGIWVQGSGTTGTQVIGNVVKNSADYGMWIRDAPGGTYRYNTVTGTKGSGWQDGITLAGSGSIGDLFDQDSLFGNAGYGLGIRNYGGAPSSTKVTTDYVYQDGSGSILDQGTGDTISGTTNAAPTTSFPAAPRSTMCPNYPVDKGTATLTINVPQAGTYGVWVRAMAADQISDSLYLQIDSGCPMLLGNGGMPANTWTWTNTYYENAETPGQSAVATLTAGSHSVRLIGREAGLKADMLLLSSSLTCVPSGTGGNCASSTSP